MILKTLIIDDEYPAREELKYHLKKYKSIHIIGEASTIDEAYKMITTLDCDLIFLDINFPLSNGIELGRKIRDMSNHIQIIYVTAHEQYAIEAFEVNASGYLLKPIDDKKLAKTLNKSIDHFNYKRSRSNIDSLTNSTPKIFGELNGVMQVLDLDDIIYAYVEHNYVFIKRLKDQLLTKYTLTELEDKLSHQPFFRANRSTLVNLNKIKSISPPYKGSISIKMNDCDESLISVSRRQSKNLKTLLDL